VANEIFLNSRRNKKPFIRVNCAAISETLIESEFFGHERGSFTGATERRDGRFELADGGTILLDEVSEIPLALQAKLLRVLQEREFERVGGNKTIQVDVRVLAATNRDLPKAVANGEFREDLYYRLNVFPLHVPALRERVEDVEELARCFLGRFGRKHGSEPTGFSSDPPPGPAIPVIEIQ
jgi:transcriptional regulator with GAF, ATPase, and Fis domain